jgi:hypothetical protein
VFPPSAQEQADEIFSKFAPGYKRVYFAGMKHGFAARCDLKDEKAKEAMDNAFRSAVDWLKEKF